MKRRGLVCVYTGNGKGKTTAALGTALRAAGHGLKVLILLFMKGMKNIGEINALKESNLPVDIRQFGQSVFFKSRACEAIDIHEATRGMEAFAGAVASEKYDLVILDEVIMAIHFGLLSLAEIQTALKNKPPALHLILTGRNAPAELIRMADLVTEMIEVKHPYREGINAQAGIEF